MRKEEIKKRQRKIEDQIRIEKVCQKFEKLQINNVEEDEDICKQFENLRIEE